MVAKVSDAVQALDRPTDVEGRPTAPVLLVPGFEITRREDAILRRLGEGESNDEVAAHLGIPGASVRWHLDQLMSKLGAETPSEAVARWHSLASRASAS
jgi:DNA-binding NarL/FixJ family response regulator